MRFDKFSFGSIQIEGNTYEHDVIIDRGEIRKRKKKPSKKFREQFGHTPLSIKEEIPWKCQRLVVGTGAYGRLPVMKEVDAQRRTIELLVLPTAEPSRLYSKTPKAPMQSCTSRVKAISDKWPQNPRDAPFLVRDRASGPDKAA
jgi:hypothetical protein